MPSDYLLIDVGNGRTKFGLATRDQLLEHRDAPTSGLMAGDLNRVLQDWEYQRVIVSSVVPIATMKLRNYFGEKMQELRHDTARGLVIKYPAPETIGPDRLANAIALTHLYGAPGVVIDFGTAVTFDIVDAEGAYIGGIIAPGLRLMTDYLHERTALLPQVDLREPVSVVGKTTEQAILAGAAIGYRGMVHGILESLKAELGHPPSFRIVATGGDAAWIASNLPEIETVDADLTLHGLRLVGNLHAPL